MGDSGSGKSTLLDLTAGLIKPTTGKIFLDDKNNLSDAFHNWKSKIGFVAQRNYFLNYSSSITLEFLGIIFYMTNLGHRLLRRLIVQVR